MSLQQDKRKNGLLSTSRTVTISMPKDEDMDEDNNSSAVDGKGYAKETASPQLLLKWITSGCWSFNDGSHEA